MADDLQNTDDDLEALLKRRDQWSRELAAIDRLVEYEKRKTVPTAVAALPEGWMWCSEAVSGEAFNVMYAVAAPVWCADRKCWIGEGAYCVGVSGLMSRGLLVSVYGTASIDKLPDPYDSLRRIVSAVPASMLSVESGDSA